MSDESKYQEAKKRVGIIKGFYIHLASYILVNALLVAINYLTYPDYLWFIWSVMGWGAGLITHGLVVFFISSLWAKSWEERKIKQLMGKDISAA